MQGRFEIIDPSNRHYVAYADIDVSSAGYAPLPTLQFRPPSSNVYVRVAINGSGNGLAAARVDDLVFECTYGSRFNARARRARFDRGSGAARPAPPSLR